MQLGDIKKTYANLEKSKIKLAICLRLKSSREYQIFWTGIRLCCNAKVLDNKSEKLKNMCSRCRSVGT